jgi:hypothetical protein
MKKFIILFLFFISFSFKTSADIYTENLRICLVRNSTEMDRIAMVKWVFSSLGQHYALKNEFNISSGKKEKYDKGMADYFHYIVGNKCRNEFLKSLRGNPKAAEKAFEYLGQSAMEQLMTDRNVAKAFEDFAKYIDPNIFKK